MQAADNDLAPVLEWLKSGREKPGAQELRPYSPATKAYCAQWNNLKLENGVIYRQYFDENGGMKYLQLLVPWQMRDTFLQEINGNVAGHLSAQKTQYHVQERGYWYGWRKDVEIFCMACVPCNQYFRGMAPRHGRLQDMRTGAPIERLHIDLSGPFPRSENTGMTYICTCICAFTKYAVAVPIPDKSAVTVARAILEHVILRLGCPDCILSDNGREFENALFRELCKGLNILKA